MIALACCSFRSISALLASSVTRRCCFACSKVTSVRGMIQFSTQRLLDALNAETRHRCTAVTTDVPRPAGCFRVVVNETRLTRVTTHHRRVHTATEDRDLRDTQRRSCVTEPTLRAHIRARTCHQSARLTKRRTLVLCTRYQ